MWWVCFFVTVAVASNDILVLERQLNASECQSIVQQAGNQPRIVISKDPTWSQWDKRLFDVFGNALLAYNGFIGHPLGANQDSGYVLIQRNTTHDSVAPFCEYKAVYAVLFLNGDVAGGQWYFPRQKETFEPECGRLLMFPDTFTHPRAVRDVRLGTSWVIVTSFKSRS